MITSKSFFKNHNAQYFNGDFNGNDTTVNISRKPILQ